MARKHFGAGAKAMATFEVKSPERGKRRGSGCVSNRRGEVITEVVKEAIVEEEEVRCQGEAPNPHCEPTR